MVTWLLSIAAISLAFMHVFVPLQQKKPNQMRRDIVMIASVVEEYKKEEHDLPLTLQQLSEFQSVRQPAEIEPFPLNDPWGKPYAYQRINSDSAIIGSSYRNRRVETDLAVLSAKPDLEKFKIA